MPLVTAQHEIQFNIRFHAACLNCSLSNHAAFMEQRTAHQVFNLEVKNSGTLTAFLKGVLTLSCQSFKSVRGIKTVK